MGLQTDYIDVYITNRNKTHYKNLGYDIPAFQGDTSSETIRVKIVDVPKCSHVIINDLVCDCCGKQLHWSIADYYRRNHDGKTYCNKCAHTILNSGVNNNKWNPNLTEEERMMRRDYPEYVEFSKKVLYRDHYTCQCCGHVGTNLEVHHLNGYDWYIEGRTDVTNAITLCSSCHKNFHIKYGKDGNTKEQFNEWIGYTIDYLDDFDGELPPARPVICLETKEVYANHQDAAIKNNTQASRINKCCMMYDSIKYKQATKSVNGKHYLYLDVYNNMTEKDIEEYLAWCKTTTFHTSDNRHSSCKRIVLLNNKTVFRSIRDAAEIYHCSPGGITDCCKGKMKYCGMDKDTHLRWMYLDDYIKTYTDAGLKGGLLYGRYENEVC